MNTFNKEIKDGITLKNQEFFDFKSLPEKELTAWLEVACKNGDLPLVRYLLTSGELPIHASIVGNYSMYSILGNKGSESTFFAENQSPLVTAIKYKHYEIIEYLCESKELKVKANLRFLDDYIIVLLAKDNDIEMIEFLINHPTIKNKPNVRSSVIAQMIHEQVPLPTIKKFLNDKYYVFTQKSADSFLEVACTYGQLEVFQYLLTESKVKASITKVFIEKISFTILLKNRIDTINYLLNDCAKQVNNYFKDYLEEILIKREKLTTFVQDEKSIPLLNILFNSLNNIQGLEEAVCKSYNFHLIDYIVHERKISYTENIKNLELLPLLRKEFEARELNNKLQETLNINTDNTINKKSLKNKL